MKSFLITILYTLSIVSFGQNKKVTVEFVPVYQNKKLVLGKEYSDQSISFETLKFYISQLQFSVQNQVIFEEQQSYHLLDLSIPQSFRIDLKIPKESKFNQLAFSLGIDSLTNVSGVMGGDLDPMKGMYWAWQSGYINFKLEGTSPDCPARLNTFQFHLGGYLPPYQSAQKIVLDCKMKNKIIVYLHIDQFLERINLSKQYKIMSPSQEAKILSEQIAKTFEIHEK